MVLVFRVAHDGAKETRFWARYKGTGCACYAINKFRNHQDEQVTDNLIDIDDIILSQFGPAVGDPADLVPMIPTSAALESLYKLYRHEEQQADGDQSPIRHLLRHERA